MAVVPRQRPVVISGMDRVLRNLNREVAGIQNRTRGGLREAALVVRRRSQELTPVHTGHLKASAYTEVFDTSQGPAAEIGYMAGYAIYVHEIDKNYRVGQWKFLETALKEKAQKILEIIKKRARPSIGRASH